MIRQFTISRLGLVFACCAIGVLRADDLILADGARLTGTVRSINEAGVLELATAISPEPLMMKVGSVEKVEFSAPKSEEPPAGTLIELANGDLLSASIENWDDKILDVSTEDVGRLSIPRAALKSIRLGACKQNVIYRGPKNAAEWGKYTERAESWQFTNHALTADGPSQSSKEFEAPEQFVFKFTLKWQANPMFKIYFADPLTPQVDLTDRYFMQYGSAGLEIKRESSKGKHYQTVIQLLRGPKEFPANELAVEIRVDRKASRLHLLINGKPEGTGADPVGDAPQGNGVVFINNAPAGLVQEIRGIEILEFDDAGTRHRAEERGDEKTDRFISRDEGGRDGRLMGIRKGAKGLIFSFKGAVQEEPLELPESDVSTVFFAKPPQVEAPAPQHQLALRLRGEGFLHVSSCEFSAEDVSARHPLLGPLKIRRAGIASLERLDSNPEEKSKE